MNRNNRLGSRTLSYVNIVLFGLSASLFYADYSTLQTIELAKKGMDKTPLASAISTKMDSDTDTEHATVVTLSNANTVIETNAVETLNDDTIRMKLPLNIGNDSGTQSTVMLDANSLPTTENEAEVSSSNVGLPISQADTIEPADETREITTNIPEDSRVVVDVRHGDSLSKIFYRVGLTDRDVYEVNRALKKNKKSFVLHPNDRFIFTLSGDGDIKEIRRETSSLESIVVTREEKSYQVKKVMREPEIRLAEVTGTIRSNLFVDTKRAGLSRSLSMELADIFGWDIDFALDLRKGDRFTVIFEEHLLDGRKIGNGGIVAARFTNNGKTFTTVRHEIADGEYAYYTPEGDSMRKAFIRSPVAFHRISSKFNKSRYHPVLGKKRPHNGVDYAARTGTPIKAAGSGKIIWAGQKGGYGNTIIIRHPNGITTLYAHQKKFAKGIRSGKTVKQGQLIGYVGSTGLASGPHLHYEFRINGIHKNPLTVKLPNDAPLSKKHKAEFMVNVDKYLDELNRLESIEVASTSNTNFKG